MITVSINNDRVELSNSTTVSDALVKLGYDSDGMLGVAVNKTFVPKDQWPDKQLEDNDQVDILNPISGG